MKASIVSSALLALTLLLPLPEQASARQTSTNSQSAAPNALESAILKKNPKQLERLLKAGADPNQIGLDDEPVLFLAAMVNDSRYLKILLANGADPKRTGPSGNSVLSTALTSENDLENLRLLLEAGADPNQADVVGNTPLHTAANLNAFEGLILLLEHGADPLAKNRAGYDLPRQLHHTEYNSGPLNARGKARLQQVKDWLQAKGIALLPAPQD